MLTPALLLLPRPAGLTKVAHIQRSCGYALRPTLSVADIGRAVQIIKAQDPSVLVLVDNCYGEFTEELEPCAVGADLCMGSLIKNPGGWRVQRWWWGCCSGACMVAAVI